MRPTITAPAGAADASASTAVDAGGAFFARRTSGLVRELSLRDHVLLILAYVSLPLGMVFTTQAGATFPGVNVALSFAICAALVLPLVVTYGLMASAMPRSGGDYLFLSRVIHPLWGYVANSMITLWQVFGTAFISLFVPQFALPALFNTLALTTGDPSWNSAATDVASRTGQLLIGGAIVIATGILMLFSLRTAVRVFTGFMVLSILGAAVTIVSLLVIDPGTFETNFAEQGTTVSTIVSTANEQGFDGAFSLGATFAAIVFVITTLGPVTDGAYWAGEVRRGSSQVMRGMFIALAAAAAVFVTIALLAQRAFGTEFMGASQFVSNSGDGWELSASPFINLFIAIGLPHSWLVALLGLTFVAGVIALAVPTYLLATRNIFAHAFEHLLPERLAGVNRRTHTPVAATIVVMILMLLFVVGFVFFSNDFGAWVGASSLVAMVTWGSVGIAAILFPFRQRDLFESSPANKRIGSVPVICIAGAITTAVCIAYIGVIAFSDYSDSIGATTTASLSAVGVIAAGFVCIWLIAWVRGKRSGLDLQRINQVLPPE